MPEWLRFVIGTLLVVQFAGLAVWQIGRGLEKRSTQQAFDAQTGFAAWSNGMQIRSYQKLAVNGRFDVEHQFLLDNIIINNRYGYYVLTPLVVGDDEPLLIVNRGWLQKTGQELVPDRIAIDASRITVHGRAGSLPKAGSRAGGAIQPGSPWPQHAVYPALTELADALGRDVQPFVLLMDPENEHGYLRNWESAEMGPAQHFAYAFQWSAIAAALAALIAWHSRKRRFRRD